jgi:hypothetical protein
MLLLLLLLLLLFLLHWLADEAKVLTHSCAEHLLQP